MRWMAWLLGDAIVLYCAMLALLTVAQRHLLYLPRPLAAPPSAFGLDAQMFELSTISDERLFGWHAAAEAGRPLALFFYGNGGNLSHRVSLFRCFATAGWGYLAIDHPDYGASPGRPSEAALLRAGEAAYAEALARGYPASSIVAFGESLGSGIAVPLAAAHPVKALVLDSAFSATVDVAAARYWMFPIRLLMRDRFRSRDLIGQVVAPKLFLHASGDPIVPIGFARMLYSLAEPPKTFIEVAGRKHVVADAVFDRIAFWVDALPG